MSGTFSRTASLAEIGGKLRALQHELDQLRARLAAETARADTATKGAQDAWRFARVAIRTGRPREDGA